MKRKHLNRIFLLLASCAVIAIIWFCIPKQPKELKSPQELAELVLKAIRENDVSLIEPYFLSESDVDFLLANKKQLELQDPSQADLKAQPEYWKKNGALLIAESVKALKERAFPLSNAVSDSVAVNPMQSAFGMQSVDLFFGGRAAKARTPLSDRFGLRLLGSVKTDRGWVLLYPFQLF